MLMEQVYLKGYSKPMNQDILYAREIKSRYEEDGYSLDSKIDKALKNRADLMNNGIVVTLFLFIGLFVFAYMASEFSANWILLGYVGLFAGYILFYLLRFLLTKKCTCSSCGLPMEKDRVGLPGGIDAVCYVCRNCRKYAYSYVKIGD